MREHSASDINRLTIKHLMIWCAVTAALLTLQTIRFGGSESLLSAGLIILQAGCITVVMPHIFQPARFCRLVSQSPGNVLCLYVASYTICTAVAPFKVSSPAIFVGHDFASLLAVPIGAGSLMQSRHPWPWRCFICLVTVSMAISQSWLPPPMLNIVLATSAALSFLAAIVLVVAIINDWLQGISRGWSHWLGITAKIVPSVAYCFMLSGGKFLVSIHLQVNETT